MPYSTLPRHGINYGQLSFMAGHQTDILDVKTSNNQYFNTGASPAIKHDEYMLRNKEVCESDWLTG